MIILLRGMRSKGFIEQVVSQQIINSEGDLQRAPEY